MIVHDVATILDSLAPLQTAADWDNVGLLVGDALQPVRRVLLTIDYTEAVAREVASAGCELVVAYHPPVFKSLKRLPRHSLIAQAICQGIAIYSPHTALDVAEGGTNDVLAGALGLTVRQPIKPLAEVPSTTFKLIFFVPPQFDEAVCAALFAAGAGNIGKYSACSFRSAGTGTFLGALDTQPHTGRPGERARADELRVEVVVPAARLTSVLQALRETHPYEEPAFDMQPRYEAQRLGWGRIGPMAGSRREAVARLKQNLGLAQVLIAGSLDLPAECAAVCAGAGGEFLDAALARGAKLFVTGELRHHDALKVVARGATAVMLLHSNSERAALVPLAERLRLAAPALEVIISRSDCDPITFH